MDFNPFKSYVKALNIHCSTLSLCHLLDNDSSTFKFCCKDLVQNQQSEYEMNFLRIIRILGCFGRVRTVYNWLSVFSVTLEMLRKIFLCFSSLDFPNAKNETIRALPKVGSKSKTETHVLLNMHLFKTGCGLEDCDRKEIKSG